MPSCPSLDEDDVEGRPVAERGDPTRGGGDVALLPRVDISEPFGDAGSVGNVLGEFIVSAEPLAGGSLA